MEGSGPLEKSLEFPGTFFLYTKRSSEWGLESPRRIEKFVEYSRIYGFVLYLAYDIIVVPLRVYIRINLITAS